MSYFPYQIMPKMLMKETSKEVDDNPSIYNAKNWNTHHREIRAIEEFLLGNKDPDSIIFSGKDQQGTTYLPSSISSAVANIRYLLEELFNGCWLTQYSGTVQYKNYIKIPDCLIQTKTSGTVNDFDTTIAVESTKGFPQSGTITKINGTAVQQDPITINANSSFSDSVRWDSFEIDAQVADTQVKVYVR